MNCKIALAIFFACGLLFCDLGGIASLKMDMTAEEFMHNYFDVYDDRDIVAMDVLFSYPFYGI